jgi:hypothetical protein
MTAPLKIGSTRQLFLDDHVVERRDGVCHVVTWNDDPDLASVAGTPVRLRFHLNNAALYSFRIGGGSAPPGPFDLNLHAPGNRGRP